MLKSFFILFFAFIASTASAQLLVARDTITVRENGYVLKMPWANGINYSNVSNIDLNFDGKKDIVIFDKINQLNHQHLIIKRALILLKNLVLREIILIIKYVVNI
jgi:hypothetical protein